MKSTRDSASGAHSFLTGGSWWKGFLVDPSSMRKESECSKTEFIDQVGTMNWQDNGSSKIRRGSNGPFA